MFSPALKREPSNKTGYQVRIELELEDGDEDKIVNTAPVAAPTPSMWRTAEEVFMDHKGRSRSKVFMQPKTLSPDGSMQKTKSFEFMEKRISLEDCKTAATTPASATSSKSLQIPDRRNSALQMAAGHGSSSLIRDIDGPIQNGVCQYVLKIYDEIEARNYNLLESSKDALLQFTPRYLGEIDHDGEDEIEVSETEWKAAMGRNSVDFSERTQRYMRLSNLLLNFSCECLVFMDVNIGCRTFFVHQAVYKTPRGDLYKKIIKLVQSLCTEEEHRSQAIT
jgi:hypothetical protein